MISIDEIFWLSILCSSILVVLTLMSIGNTIHDLIYQKVRRINGIRHLQVMINLRIDLERLFLAVAIIVITIFSLFIIELYDLVYFGRLFLLAIVCLLAINTTLDFIDETKQLCLLLQAEEVNNINKIRVNLHALNNKTQKLFGLVLSEIQDDRVQTQTIELQEQIADLIKAVQYDIHEMDPSYPKSRALYNVSEK